MIKSKSILLLKSQKSSSSSDKYEDILTSNDFKVKQVKTLVFDFKNINVLKENLKRSLIFSSPRCVHAVHLAVKHDEDIIKSWQRKHNFVVGEATYKDALDKLNLECEGKESGNASNLSKKIIESIENFYLKKPFLFPHGNLKTDTLNLELGKEGVKIVGVLYFSALSGLRSSISYLRSVPVDLNDVKIIAIGPVTELAVKEENLKVYGVTKQPTPQEVFNVIANS
ncbi:hypothetical protein NQ317_008204 [Molorchus minor]|uniref:Tetrapyrrole biosynthesis uroporphyrinogen III synthase domain-containing protein n=1 Tax=Molorchus minor TaxID=1323400 RepID=A0ABQ9JB12_9CUCU|nr:hypothetical protein NQ317_008204 [Molorchus minor]